ncbi:MAG: UvrD-helicase domain-containing protein, partial [bacterium]|nr:UvrD-helicase domain-containing protein [bacterium]
MSNNIFESLNEKQVEAVKIVDGPVLVISGPGSGKTRCLTHRAAYLISQGIPPENILAVTFTNKASGEMRDRISNLLEVDPMFRSSTSKHIQMPLIGTFHSVGLRILRNEITQLGYRRNFTVFDEDDQLSLVKRVMGDLEIDTKSFNPKIILYKISELKTQLIFPESYEPKDFYPEIVSRVYKAYQKELQNLNAVDFDDLIVLPVKIFKQNEETLRKYQDSWKYILVDEYQDTSHDQYIFINLLAQKYRNLFCIGDDAQCLLPGTKITTEGGIKNIEKVKTGNKIISPAGLNQTCSSEVTASKKFRYDGPIIEIRTKKGYVLKSTPNHVLFGKLLPSKNFFITYLMYSKRIGYRIGITVGVRHPRNGKKALGLRVRANQEKSDKIWILKLSSNRAEAQFWEAYYAFKYGIPTTVFFADRGKGSTPMLLTQEHIDKLFEAIPSAERAANLMRDEYLFPEYPHHRPQGTIRYQTRRITVNLSYFSTQPSLRSNSLHRGARVSINNSDKKLQKLLLNAGLKIRAGKSGTWRMETSLRDHGDAEILAEKISSLCNVEISKRALITNLLFDFLPASQIHPHMTLPVFNGQKIINDEVVSVKRLNYNGPVYDLNIKKTHTYIANNIVVHNSIYQFRRADIRNILNFQKDYSEAKIVMLEQNYRSTKNIITAAQEIISKNKNQLPKSLWTENNHGEKIIIAETMNERHEANFVISKIKELLGKDYTVRDFAILYRT